MSSPKRRFILTPRAQAHLRSIRRYTIQQWGRHQYTAYRAKLMVAMERLTEFPALGIAAPNIAPNLHSFPVEQHVIYYRFTKETVHVIGILHSRMHVAQLDP